MIDCKRIKWSMHNVGEQLGVYMPWGLSSNVIYWSYSIIIKTVICYGRKRQYYKTSDTYMRWNYWIFKEHINSGPIVLLGFMSS